MTFLLGFAAFLLLPVIGIGIWRLDAIRRLDLSGRLAVAGAAGAAITGAIMAALSVFGIEWSRGRIIALLAVAAAIGVFSTRRRGLSDKAAVRPDWATAGIAAFLLLTTYGLITARESSGDLHFFWGPRSIHFYHDGGITAPFLADRNNADQNPGYPPLLPLLYAWSLTVSRQFSWMAAVLSTALFFLGSVVLVRSTSGDRRAALLMAATLAYAVAVGFAAGGAELPLVFFETLTLVALTFIDDPRAQTVLAALGLAGAVMLKIEGTTFAIATVIALLVIRRPVRTTLLIAAPAALLLAGWLWFIKTNGIPEFYRGGGMPIYFEALPKVLLLTVKAAGYELFGLPWIVPLLLVAFGDVRRAALPLIVALLTIGAAIFFYVHVPDQTWWIASSAPRVLLTPLTAVLIAVAAAWRQPRTARSARSTEEQSELSPGRYRALVTYDLTDKTPDIQRGIHRAVSARAQAAKMAAVMMRIPASNGAPKNDTMPETANTPAPRLTRPALRR